MQQTRPWDCEELVEDTGAKDVLQTTAGCTSGVIKRQHASMS